MPTPTQVSNRRQPLGEERHHLGTVTATPAGRPVTVTLDAGPVVEALSVSAGAVWPVGTRVLILTTPMGNFALGRIAT